MFAKKTIKRQKNRVNNLAANYLAAVTERRIVCTLSGRTHAEVVEHMIANDHNEELKKWVNRIDELRTKAEVELFRLLDLRWWQKIFLA